MLEFLAAEKFMWELLRFCLFGLSSRAKRGIGTISDSTPIPRYALRAPLGMTAIIVLI